ncbi:hypothetical protein RSWS8N_15065 [Cereibacter sphaeroides WS8N]|nr:hypothetical protein RSWS8N_15065 [Cereibacter sphaeroides WS8N]
MLRLSFGFCWVAGPPVRLRGGVSRRQRADEVEPRPICGERDQDGTERQERTDMIQRENFI